MTPEELAVSALNYLTGKESALIPLNKDDVVTSANNIGSRLRSFIEDMEKQVIDEYDEETRTGIVEESVDYDVTYTFGESDSDEVAIIFGITDRYRTTYEKGKEVPETDLLKREIKFVTIEAGSIDAIDINASPVKELLYEYAPISERVYEAFNTKRWQFVFKWDGLQSFIKQNHAEWDKYKSNEDREKGSSLPPFAKFQKDTRKQLKKYLQDGKSESFILFFVEETLDTAHLYGMNEKRK